MAAYITLNTDMKQASGGNVRLMLWTNSAGMSNKVFAIEVLPRSADPTTARYRFSHICSVSELVELPDYDNGDTPYFRTDAVDFILEHASQVTPILRHMRADIKQLSADYNTLYKDGDDSFINVCPHSLMRGLWNEASTYPVNTFVIFNNTMWRCIQECKGEIPATGSTYWEKVLTSGGAAEGGSTVISYMITDRNGVLTLPSNTSFVILRNQIDSGYQVNLVYLGEIYTLSIISEDHVVFTHNDAIYMSSLRVNSDSSVTEHGVFDGTVVKSTNELPEATADLVGVVLIYIGQQTDDRKRGHYYMCDVSDGIYSWVDITPIQKTPEVVIPEHVIEAPEIPGQPNQVLGIDANGKTAWMNVAEIAKGGTYWMESI